MQLGVHFALDDALAERLLATRGEAEALAGLLEQIEEGELAAFSCDSDKAWDPILCTFSAGGYERDPEIWPAYGVVMGDEDLNHDTDDQLVTYLAPPRAAEVAAFLAEVTEEDFSEVYLRMPEEGRNPEHGPEELAYAWEILQELVEFFRRAAAERTHVVFTVVF